MTTQNVGQWSNWHFELTDEALAVFQEALKDWTGVGFEPLAYTTQLVNGTNYCFLAKATTIVPDMPQWVALLHVLKPLDRPAFVTGIDSVKP